MFAVSKKILFIVILVVVPMMSYGGVDVVGYRVADKESYTRFVLEVARKVDYKVFTLSDPSRVVIDLVGAKWLDDVRLKGESNRIDGIRQFEHADDKLRIVLDVNQPVRQKNDFLLSDVSGQFHRLVIDVFPTNPMIDAFARPHPVTKQGVSVGVPVPQLREKVKKLPLVVIDAGHGGHDPGTIGRRGTKEKDITLKYAKELRRQLLSTGDYRVYMIRSSDVFVKLRDRVKKARGAGGDLFISVHANAHRSSRTYGFSVYTLSETASDKEAAALARKENKSGILNGIDLDSEMDDMTAVFIDMAQRDTKNQSASFAELLVSGLRNEVKLLRNPHRFAGFRVLTGADIPSVLLELGYLTNKKEEKLLKSEKYKKKLAKVIVEAIDSHFSQYKVE